MIYALYIKPFGVVTLHLDTVVISGFNLYVTGYDCNKSRIDFVMNKFTFLEDDVYDCGYCRIKQYTKDGVTTTCNIYQSVN